MNINNKSKIFFGTALIIMFVLSVMFMSPFLVTLSLSVVIAVSLNPVYKKLTVVFFKNKTIGAIITILLSYILIFLPLTLVAIQAVKEVQDVYVSVGVINTQTVSSLNQGVNNSLKDILPNIDIHLEKYIGDVSSWLMSYSGTLFSSTFDLLFKILIITISIFFLLRDGEVIQSSVKELVPISSKIYDYLVSSFKSSINSIIFGSIFIVIIQGLLSGIGFAMFGIPNAMFWGLIATITSFIPTIGAGIIFAPIIIYTLFFGTSFQAIGLLLWSTLIVGTVDNLLRPVIMHKSMNLHPLLVLFSALGGIGFIGPAGVILGPLTLSLLFALMRAYKMENVPSATK